MSATDLHNVEAEQAILGALLIDAREFDDVAAVIGAAHFWDPVHGRIFTAIETRLKAGRRADAVSVAAALATDEGVASLGGAPAYLATLLDAAFPEMEVEYAKIVRDLASRREIIRVAQGAQIDAERDRERSAADIASETERALAGICEAGSAALSFSSGEDGADDVIAGIAEARKSGGVTGVRTGLKALDDRTGGLQQGNLIIIGGRPSMGKTALALEVAIKAALEAGPSGERQRVFFASLEMTRRQVWQRALVSQMRSRGGNTHLTMLRKGIVGRGDHDVFDDSVQALRDLRGHLLVDDERAVSVSGIHRRARAASREMGGLDLVVIDYLGLVAKPDAKGRNEASVIGEQSRGLKLMGGDLGVPVVVLSQLSRGVESRDNKRPMLSDLRDSGAIEQDADDIFFVYRDAYYLQRQMDSMKSGDKAKYAAAEEEFRLCERTLEVICAKQRQGPIGTDLFNYFQEFNFISDRVGDL